MKYSQVPAAQIKQAIKELSREELEVYASMNGIIVSLLASLVTDQEHLNMSLRDFGYSHEEAVFASNVSLKMQKRVEQLTVEKN